MHGSSRKYWRVRTPFCRRSDREFLSPKETLLCCATFATALTTAMARARTKQVSVESTAFLFKRLHSSANLSSWTAAVPGVLADSSAREDIFKRSGLDWTLVRPPRLMDGHHSGRCPVRQNHLPRFGLKISRADVAHCVLGILGRLKSTEQKLLLCQSHPR
jgi:hypothetical protein